MKDVRTIGGGGFYQMRTLLLIFACKRPKSADTGGGGVKKRSIFADVFHGWPLSTFAMYVVFGYPLFRYYGGLQ